MTGELIRVLAAVRDAEVAAAIRRSLSPQGGYMLTEAGSVAEGLGVLGRGGSDLLIVELPAEGGGAEAVPPGGSSGGRPVVVVAERAREGEAVRAVRGGCADYLLKEELHPALVKRVVRHAVERARTERRRRRAEDALVDSEHRYRGLFEQSRDAIFMTERDGEIVEVNGAALELLGYGEDELLGRSLSSIYADAGDRERFRQELIARGQVRDFEVRVLRRDGGELWCLVSAWARRGEGGEVEGYQGIVHDITGRKRIEEQLIHEALHDRLTELPNRALFMDRLERAVARRRRGEERELAVLFLDLDRFKVVNDSLGHLVGDDLLQQLARLLKSEVREEDTVARIGGDEFAILLDGVDDAADPTHVAERIQERLRRPFRVRGHDVFTSASIGITFGGAAAGRAEELLRDADTAMYRAKETGPARYQIFDEAMHAHAVTLLQLETDLRLALERGEFVVHYQPMLEIAESRLIGFEALVRWQHPSEGLIGPQAFIPVAEDTGLIVQLGEWVLRTAAAQMREWQDRDPGRAGLFVSVNLSARQFSHSDLVAVVREVLESTRLEGSSLRLELTESVVMRSPDEAVRTLRSLRDMGVGLCIDDFGTGYSSLNYLHDFPIDTLKIDRSFIARMAEQEDGIVATIVAMAKNLGLQSVAEGVETQAQLDRLRELGPASVQGFLFSSPLDREAAGALLDERIPPAGKGRARRGRQGPRGR